MANQTNLYTAATGNVTSSVAARSKCDKPGAIVIASTAGGTPTVTVNIQGSSDGAAYYNIPYALVATPSTFVVAALTITTTVTVTYLLQTDQPWTYVRLVMSANTNMTLTADAYL